MSHFIFLLESLIPFMLASASGSLNSSSSIWSPTIYDEARVEHVMNLMIVCSSPVTPGPVNASKDGIRDEYWPITGGRADGPNFHATVVPGGADLPLYRPDGVYAVDALYRLQTDDNQQIVIHNAGIEYPTNETDFKMRTSPTFIAPDGKYSWLNKNLFVANLIIPAPSELELPTKEDENQRLIQIWRIY